MDKLDLSVGTLECPIRSVALVLHKSPIIRNSLINFVKGLEIPNTRTEKFKQDLQRQKITEYDLIMDALQLWVDGSGSKATLGKLFQILGKGFKAGAEDIEESIRLEFNLPCRNSINNNSISWSQLSPLFQQRVKTNLEQLSPTLAFEELLPILKGSILNNLMTGNNGSIFNQTLPVSLSYYVNRTIFSRCVISNEILRQHFPDVFLLTGIDRYQLISLAGTQEVRQSSEQVKIPKLTVKFIILDDIQHFDHICKQTDMHIHWFHYENGKLEWIKSRGEMYTLQKYISKSQLEQEEEDFCLKKSDSNQSNQPVCISDTPGMGKSVLLAQIGRRLIKQFPDKIVVFLVLSEFIRKFRQSSCKNRMAALEQTLMDSVSNNELGKAVLKSKLTSVGDTIPIELLLDGLDEVNSTDIDLAYELLQVMRTSCKSMRLWVTSRPHLQTELENRLSVLGYTIRPFDEQNQLRFLTSFWSLDRANDDYYQARLKAFAENSLQLLKSKMNSKEQDIGVPLLCLLIGEVYEEEAISFAKSEETSSVPSVLINSIKDLYKTLIIKKFQKYLSVHMRQYFHGIDTLMEMHVSMSLHLLFPLDMDNLEVLITPVTDMEEMLKIGIVESSNITGSPRFMHRTVAEYFVAWFLIDRLKDGRNPGWSGELSSFFLDTVLASETRLDEIETATFLQPVITYFLDSMIADISLASIPTHFLQHLSKRTSCTSPPAVSAQGKFLEEDSKRSGETLRLIAISCARSDFPNIFNLFDELKAFDSQSEIIFDDLFIILAIENSGLELIKLATTHFEKHAPEEERNFDIKDESLTYSYQRGVSSSTHRQYSLLYQSKVLHALFQRCQFSTVEFFIKKKGFLLPVQSMEEEVLNTLLLDCVTISEDKPEAEIDLKLEVVRMLVRINPARLNETNRYGNTPLLARSSPVRLRKELISLGANIFAQDKFNDTVLHRVEPSLSPQDYHSLLISIREEDLGQLVKIKGRQGNEPLMKVVKSIDPIMETLTMFKMAGADFNSIDNFGHSVLANAVLQGRSSKTLQNLIHHGSDIDWKRTNSRESLLHLAAESGNVEAIVLLLHEYGMDVNIENELGQNPLSSVLTSSSNTGKRFESGLLLHERGGTFKEIASGPSNQSLLHVATKVKNVDSMRLLFYLEADVNRVDSHGNTPLHTCMVHDYGGGKGYFSVTKLLLDNGANPNLLNKLRNTPLQTAVKNGIIDLETIQLLKSKTDETWILPLAQLAQVHLMEHDVGPDPDNFTPAAKLFRDVEVEVDMDFKDTDGNPMLHLAAEYQSDKGVRYLVRKKGATLFLKNNWGQTVLHKAAVGRDANFSLRIIQYLIDIPGAVSLVHPALFQLQQMMIHLSKKKYSALFESKGGPYLRTPLHLAALHAEPSLKSMTMLHADGVDFNIVDKLGRSVLAYAIWEKQETNLLSHLIELGADWKVIDKRKNNLLHFGAKRGNYETLIYLLSLGGLDVNGVNDDGNTPLHFALLNEDRENVMARCKLLIENMAEVNMQNMDGDTPLAIAMKRKYKEDELLGMLYGN